MSGGQKQPCSESNTDAPAIPGIGPPPARRCPRWGCDSVTEGSAGVFLRLSFCDLRATGRVQVGNGLADGPLPRSHSPRRPGDPTLPGTSRGGRGLGGSRLAAVSWPPICSDEAGMPGGPPRLAPSPAWEGRDGICPGGGASGGREPPLRAGVPSGDGETPAQPARTQVVTVLVTRQAGPNTERSPAPRRNAGPALAERPPHPEPQPSPSARGGRRSGGRSGRNADRTGLRGAGRRGPERALGRRPALPLGRVPVPSGVRSPCTGRRPGLPCSVVSRRELGPAEATRPTRRQGG